MTLDLAPLRHDEALELAASETAARLGRFRAGIIALWVQIDILADRGDWTAAIECCEALPDLARRLGAHRFEPFGLLHRGKMIANKQKDVPPQEHHVPFGVARRE